MPSRPSTCRPAQPPRSATSAWRRWTRRSSRRLWPRPSRRPGPAPAGRALGFAALTAVRKLRAADAALVIDVVAPRPEFVYYPGTIWIPTGLRQPDELVVPLENFFRRQNVTYHQAAAEGLRDGGRTLLTDRGHSVTLFP